MIRVLFVCTGNICRSPTAEGVFRDVVERAGLAAQVAVESAGTHAYHSGEGADRRALRAAAERGIDLSEHVARQIARKDFQDFDYVLAMDRENYSHLVAAAPATHRARVALFMDFARELGVSEVPDPYYGRHDGFEHVLDLVEAASEGLLADVKSTLAGRTKPSS
jgi:protein-tyrosine phosphatase